MKNRPLNFPDKPIEALAYELTLPWPDTSTLEGLVLALQRNRMHDDVFELARRDLVDYYEITLDDFGNYATIGKPAELLQNGLEAIQKALAETNMSSISDDGSDYLNSLADQLSFLARVYSDFDDKETEKQLLHILNEPDDTDDGDAMAFRYGFADHGSPISDLARLNSEYRD